MIFHADAIQAPSWLPVGVDDLGVDMLSLLLAAIEQCAVEPNGFAPARAVIVRLRKNHAGTKTI